MMATSLSLAWVREWSRAKGEPDWMTQQRCHAIDILQGMRLPTWGPDLSDIAFDNLLYYVDPHITQTQSWSEVPPEVRATFDRLGVPQAEQELLAGVGAQFESEVIYQRLKAVWREQGVIFCDMATAVRDYPDLVQRYMATIIPVHDNFFAALNTAVWSGGSFVYVPPGVHVTQPLQAYFRIERERMGQFERTLIIVDQGALVHYVEGCSAPRYDSSSLHAAVVEIVALPGSCVTYTTIQNWSSNVYNLVTKRAYAHERARVSWIDGNFGSKVTMKYPSVILAGAHAQGYLMSIAVAGKDQHHDTGGKMIHLAPYTTSTIISKSIGQENGRSSYRGLVKIAAGAHHSRSRVQCDALLLTSQARADTYPTMHVATSLGHIGHEASLVRLEGAVTQYIESRGIAPQDAVALMINGFIQPFVDQLPMEYAIEINRLIVHDMEGSVG
jgi:Fe-S cluster assembly protein SufB